MWIFPPSPAPPPAQVLLSQTHRHRALVLLAKFLDKGAWAVNQALSVGIFPYVLKLLQSPAAELRDVLVFIWAKVMHMRAHSHCLCHTSLHMRVVWRAIVKITLFDHAHNCSGHSRNHVENNSLFLTTRSCFACLVATHI